MKRTTKKLSLHATTIHTLRALTDEGAARVHGGLAWTLKCEKSLCTLGASTCAAH
jgi:hypothetical protein